MTETYDYSTGNTIDTWSDGSVKTFYAPGAPEGETSHEVDADGTVIDVALDGSSVDVDPDGTVIRTFTDGTVETDNTDGNSHIVYPNGNIDDVSVYGGSRRGQTWEPSGSN
jgi:hypothetical protein